MIRNPVRPELLAAGVAILVIASVAAPVAIGGPAENDLREERAVQFRDVSQSCGLDYRTSGDATGSDDGGVAVADYDRDGWPDLLALGGDHPILFENRGDEADARFERSGALPDGEYPQLKSGLFFDADGDGWQELLLIPKTGAPVFLDNEAGTYRRADAGLDAELRWGTGASVADFDADGDLDVIVIQNGNWTEGTPRRGADGEATDGYPNLLFENLENSSNETAPGADTVRFERVESDAVAGSRWSLAVSAVDLTDDGRPDVHVANDYGYDALLVNRGNMTFERRPLEGTNFHGMASVVRDVNGDGRLDLFVTNIEFANPQDVWELNSGLNVRNEGNNLLLNRGNGSFIERATEYGVRQGGWGWAAAVEDFDSDGGLDVLHATKHYLERTEDDDFAGVATDPSLWEQRSDGRFERRNASEAGLAPSNGRGLATVDFDRDGDRDVAIADTSDRFRLYESAAEGGNWLQVRVRGGDGTALGTRIEVATDRGTITRVQSSRSGFFSQSSRTMHFGLGNATVEKLRIERPDGTETVFGDVESNRRLEVAANGSLIRHQPSESGC